MFALTTYTSAVLASITTRTECHGEDKVPAVTLGFKITGPNTILDNFGSPYDFRHALYTAPEGQEQLEGIDSTPLLRTVGMGQVRIDVPKHEGWRLLIDHGLDESAPIDMGNCSVSKFKLEAIDGSVEAFERDHPDAGDLFAAEHGTAQDEIDALEESAS